MTSTSNVLKRKNKPFKSLEGVRDCKLNALSIFDLGVRKRE
jgi:hypothetical protein